MDSRTFKRLVTRAIARNPHCVYCGRDLSGLGTMDLMYMKFSKRAACRDCPEAIVVMTLPPEKRSSRTANSGGSHGG
jgi:hypothetical protein